MLWLIWVIAVVIIIAIIWYSLHYRYVIRSDVQPEWFVRHKLKRKIRSCKKSHGETDPTQQFLDGFVQVLYRRLQRLAMQDYCVTILRVDAGEKGRSVKEVSKYGDYNTNCYTSMEPNSTFSFALEYKTWTFASDFQQDLGVPEELVFTSEKTKLGSQMVFPILRKDQTPCGLLCVDSRRTLENYDANLKIFQSMKIMQSYLSAYCQDNPLPS